MEDMDLLDSVGIPDGPCVIVWRTAHTCSSRRLVYEELVRFARAEIPQVLGVIVLPMGDGFDVLSEDEMRQLGWQRIPAETG